MSAQFLPIHPGPASADLAGHHADRGPRRLESHFSQRPPDSVAVSSWMPLTWPPPRAIAAAELARGLFAVRRAKTGTGADYYLAPSDADVEDLEECYRLEVSGTDAGTEREVRQRVLQKVEQAHRGASNLPAVAGVVGFTVRLIVFADAEVVCELE